MSILSSFFIRGRTKSLLWELENICYNNVKLKKKMYNNVKIFLKKCKIDYQKVKIVMACDGS